MKLWEPEPRQPMTGLVGSAVLGILAAECFQLPWLVLLSVAALGALALWFRPCLWGCWAFTAVAFFALHSQKSYDHPARILAEELAKGRQTMTASGVVWSEPEVLKGRSPAYRFELLLSQVALEQREQRERRISEVKVQVIWVGSQPEYGDVVELRGAAANLPGARNPGPMDWARYLRRMGIHSQIVTRYGSDCRIVGHGAGNRLQAFAYDARRWVGLQLRKDLEDSPEVTNLIESMVLGLKGRNEEEVREWFQRTGTLHLFAVSGLNVAMLAAMVGFILKALRVGRREVVWLTIPVLVGYALVTGLSASCVRATLMGILISLAYLLDRQPVLFNSLSAAAFILLLADSQQLFSPGFQFSFVLVFTIVWLGGRLDGLLKPIGQPDAFIPASLWSPWQKLRSAAWNILASALSVTLAGWLGALVFTAGYFHLFSPGALLANLFAVPLAFCMLALGLFSVLSGMVSSTMAGLFNNANWLVAKLLLAGIHWCAQLPGSSIFVELPRTPLPRGELTVFDFGSGGAVHLRVGGQDWLLDCGSSTDFEHTLIPYLRSRGVNRLDGLLLTHGDAKHIGSANAVLAEYRPRRLVDANVPDRSSTHQQIVRRASGLRRTLRGDRVPISEDVSLEVLFPPAGWQRSAADDKALVLRLRCQGVTILLMSDSGFVTEQWLLEHELELGADLLIKGQHQRDLSGTTEFVRRVAPKVLICGALGFGGNAGSLDPWQSRMRELGIEVFRQDQTGAVRVELDSGGFLVVGFVNAQTLRSLAR